MNISIKKGDNVVVIAGKDKGKTGKVTEVYPKEGRVLVEGINMATKHKKARNQQEKSGKISINLPIDVSNVMVICPSCGKATRVYHKLVDGKKVRVCKCGTSLDKAYVKATKKDAKKAKAEASVKEEKAAKNVEKVVKNTEKTTKTAKNAEKTVTENKPASKTTAAKPAAKTAATKEKSNKQTAKNA